MYALRNVCFTRISCCGRMLHRTQEWVHTINDARKIRNEMAAQQGSTAEKVSLKGFYCVSILYFYGTLFS